jgi:hypothetical protein
MLWVAHISASPTCVIRLPAEQVAYFTTLLSPASTAAPLLYCTVQTNRKKVHFELSLFEE